MKILHVLANLELGGAQIVATQLVNEQVLRGHQVGVAAADGELWAEVDPRVRRLSMPVGTGARVRGTWHVRKALRVDSWDVVHTHQRALSTVVHAVRGRGRFCHVEHVHSRLPSASRRFLSFRADALIACGTAIAQMLVEEYGRPPGIVHTVLNGVSDHGVRRMNRPPSDRPLNIVNIARMSELKDPLRFVETIRHLRDLGVDVESTWYGDGELLDQVRATVRELALEAQVRLPGRDRQATKALASADLLLLTSRREGVPLAALEACAAGVPIIAPDVGSISDVVEPPTNGVLFHPRSTGSEIAGLLEELGQNRDRLDSMGAQARAVYERRFTLERFAQRVDEVYASAVADGSVGMRRWLRPSHP